LLRSTEGVDESPRDAVKCSAMAASSPKTTVGSTLITRPFFLVFLTVAYIRDRVYRAARLAGSWNRFKVRESFHKHGLVMGEFIADEQW
jgi:hypothetical protein